VLILAIAFAMLMAAGLKGRHSKAAWIDRKEMLRHRRTSEAELREWTHWFE
jgi:hypothetical protein